MFSLSQGFCRDRIPDLNKTGPSLSTRQILRNINYIFLIAINTMESTNNNIEGTLRYGFTNNILKDTIIECKLLISFK